MSEGAEEGIAETDVETDWHSPTTHVYHSRWRLHNATGCDISTCDGTS